MATSPSPIPSRPWRDVARELAEEQDGKRLTELTDELDKALGEQGLNEPEPKTDAQNL